MNLSWCALHGVRIFHLGKHKNVRTQLVNARGLLGVLNEQSEDFLKFTRTQQDLEHSE